MGYVVFRRHPAHVQLPLPFAQPILQPKHTHPTHHLTIPTCTRTHVSFCRCWTFQNSSTSSPALFVTRSTWRYMNSTHTHVHTYKILISSDFSPHFPFLCSQPDIDEEEIRRVYDSWDKDGDGTHTLCLCLCLSLSFCLTVCLIVPPSIPPSLHPLPLPLPLSLTLSTRHLLS